MKFRKNKTQQPCKTHAVDEIKRYIISEMKFV